MQAADHPPLPDDPSARSEKEPAIEAFHRLYYDAGPQTWEQTRWLGVRTLKCPIDLWIYQEILAELRPGLVIETGTFDGGSALYLAGVMDQLHHGRVVTVDIEERPGRPRHDRVTYVRGSSVSPDVVGRLARQARGRGPVMVILDSDHSRDHVLAELHAYADLVTPGSYLIVEDTNVNGHPVLPEFGPGPAEAVAAFLAERSDFEVDRSRERLLMTFNPGGFLHRRV
jgi:cephalosporin hydroxylase